MQTKTGIRDLNQALMFSNLKSQLHKVIGVASPAFPLVTGSVLRQILVEALLSWPGTIHSSAVTGTESIFLPSSGTLGLNLAGDEAQESHGTDL